MAGCGGGGRGGYGSCHGVSAAVVAHVPGDVRAVAVVLRGRICYPRVSHHCVSPFRLEEGKEAFGREVGDGVVLQPGRSGKTYVKLRALPRAWYDVVVVIA